MIELGVFLALVLGAVSAIFGIRKSGAKDGRSTHQAEADRRNLEAQERGRHAVHDARRDSRSNADRLRDNDAKR